MPDKPKVAFYWCASCGGCEESVVDLAEDILMVAGAVEFVIWPVAMDFKRSDVEALADGSVAVGFVNGAIRTSENEEMVRLLRKKCQVLIAYGACAHQGGIPGLANQFSREQILQFVYHGSPSTVNEAGTRPQLSFKEDGREVTLPKLWETVRTLDQVVEVDYTIPGCPPTPKLLKDAVVAVLEGKLPPKGSVLCPDIALCEECPRKDSKPTDLKFTEFKRPHQVIADPEKCLLAQGLVCLGPATRGGCGAQCTKGNMPCTGCFGPTSRVKDHGAKALSFLCSNIAAVDEKEMEKTLATIPDPVGTFYRYGLAGSLLRRKLPAQA